MRRSLGPTKGQFEPLATQGTGISGGEYGLGAVAEAAESETTPLLEAP